MVAQGGRRPEQMKQATPMTSIRQVNGLAFNGRTTTFSELRGIGRSMVNRWYIIGVLTGSEFDLE